MKIGLPLLAVLLVTAAVSTAAGPLTQTFNAPVDKVWSNAESVLKAMGWNIDKAQRDIGWISTESRRIEGEDYGVYAKGMRHALKLQLQADGPSRTKVTVERSVFKRERILWMDKDEPVTVSDQDVEKEVLSAIGKTL
jgi:hypothetical protein